MNKTASHKAHTNQLTQVAGWAGVTCILVAYISITLNLLSPQTLLYSLLNIVGSAGILASSYNKRDFQPMLLNIIWIIVAITGLISNL